MISLIFILNGYDKGITMTITMIVHTIVSRILVTLLFIVYAIPILIFICVPQKIRYAHAWIFIPVHWFYVLSIKCSLLPITYKGVENIPAEPVIFAANHQSSLDIPLLGVLSKGSVHVWLAKKELMDSFLLRYVIPLIAVLVDVTSAREAMASLRRILALVNNHHRNLMIFPEGARYTDGMIHEFFGGFVILAKKLKRPVVPVYIHGVNKIYPPGSFFIQRLPVTVIVGKPFMYEENDTDETFKQRVYNWFLEQMRQNV